MTIQRKSEKGGLDVLPDIDSRPSVLDRYIKLIISCLVI